MLYNMAQKLGTRLWLAMDRVIHSRDVSTIGTIANEGELDDAEHYC